MKMGCGGTSGEINDPIGQCGYRVLAAASTETALLLLRHSDDCTTCLSTKLIQMTCRLRR